MQTGRGNRKKVSEEIKRWTKSARAHRERVVRGRQAKEKKEEEHRNSFRFLIFFYGCARTVESLRKVHLGRDRARRRGRRKNQRHRKDERHPQREKRRRKRTKKKMPGAGGGGGGGRRDEERPRHFLLYVWSFLKRFVLTLFLSTGENSSKEEREKHTRKEREREKKKMEVADIAIAPLKEFVKDSVRLVKKCTKPDRREFTLIASKTAFGACIYAFIFSRSL